MSVIFLDGEAHYTTNAQLLTKWAANYGTAPVAGAGAFAQPGLRPSSDANGLLQNFASTGTIELAAYVKPAAQFGQWIYFYNGTGIQCSIYIYSDGHIELYRNNNVFLGASAANAITFNNQHRLYVKVVISATVGTCDVTIDGASILSLTGLNTSSQAAADCTQIRLYGNGGSNVADCIWSHVQIANTAGDLSSPYRLGALFPNGAGNYAQWTTLVGAATHYQAVNETTPDEDTTYVATATVGHMDSYAMQDTPATANVIGALAVTARVEKDDANARTLAAFLRIAGVDYVHGTTKAVNAVPYAYLQWIWQVSPATGIAFTVAEVNALEAGLKVIA